ncbi:DUF1294 domain-containing protein [Vreelandella venusta]|uniref:DUF1294 domain-containing protein n=1 Tax=Vreelandella venusta TaxID=44935 RepID=UPI00384B148D
MSQTVLLIVAIYGIASLTTYAVYAIDKRAAIKRRRRVSEKTLHWLALIGGWPGAWCAQQWLRHKTQKTTFRCIFWVTVTLNVVALFALAAFTPLR